MNTTTPDPCHSPLKFLLRLLAINVASLMQVNLIYPLPAPINLGSTYQHRVGKTDVVIASSSKLAADNVVPVKIPNRTPKSVRVPLNTQWTAVVLFLDAIFRVTFASNWLAVFQGTIDNTIEICQNRIRYCSPASYLCAWCIFRKVCISATMCH